MIFNHDEQLPRVTCLLFSTVFFCMLHVPAEKTRKTDILILSQSVKSGVRTKFRCEYATGTARLNCISEQNRGEENLRAPRGSLDCLHTRANDQQEPKNARNAQAHEGMVFGASLPRICAYAASAEGASEENLKNFWGGIRPEVPNILPNTSSTSTCCYLHVHHIGRTHSSTDKVERACTCVTDAWGP